MATVSPSDDTSLLVDQPTAAEKKQIGYYWPILVTLVVVAVDQWSKRTVEQVLGPLGSGKQIELLGGQLVIKYIVNRGASFGFLNNADLSWVFTLLALGASVGLAVWYVWKGTRLRWLQLSAGLVLAGIVGNLLDRLFNGGGVTDLLNIPNITLFRVFNVADSAITTGVTIIILTVLLRGWSQRKTTRLQVNGSASNETNQN